MTATLRLPAPVLASRVSVEAVLHARRSVRQFNSVPLALAAAGQLLWAAQGVTSTAGERTAPSAGALYPLTIYLVAGAVDGIDPGVYRYAPAAHALQSHAAGDRRPALAGAALGQAAVAHAPAALVIAAVRARTAAKYGARAQRYIDIEVGHAAQNVYLQAQSLELGTVLVGAFDDDDVRRVLELPPGEAALALLPVGTPRHRAREK